MPKQPMSPEQIETTRESILDTALSIIIEEGFKNLSARKIASRLGITATTIYNYYTSMDELNLMIRLRGFQMLHDLITERSASLENIEERFNAMIRAYIEFGLTYPDYYDIMFNLHTPKYLDYVGTDLEQLAHTEKQNALQCLSLFIEPVSQHIPDSEADKNSFINYQVIKFWSDLHGIITLNNSRLFHEVLDDVDAFIEKRTEELFQQFILIKENIDNGSVLL